MVFICAETAFVPIWIRDLSHTRGLAPSLWLYLRLSGVTLDI